MTLWPTTLLTYVWPTPMRPLMIGSTIISPTNRLSCAKSLFGDGVVDEQLQQVRIDDADERREHDGAHHDHDRQAVRPEEARDPPEGARALFRRELLVLGPHRLAQLPGPAHPGAASHRCTVIVSPSGPAPSPPGRSTPIRAPGPAPGPGRPGAGSASRSARQARRSAPPPQQRLVAGDERKVLERAAHHGAEQVAGERHVRGASCRGTSS